MIGDVAYIGLNGIGVARYEISTNSWLPTWTEYSNSPSGNSILDPGNGDVTGLVADINPDQLWIGGADGFQLIDVVNQVEVYDIEKSDALYLGNGNPFQMTIYNDIMYYHQRRQQQLLSDRSGQFQSTIKCRCWYSTKR